MYSTTFYQLNRRVAIPSVLWTPFDFPLPHFLARDMLTATFILPIDDYGALEPSISGKIMELHHKNHHQTYVNSYNAASEKLASASSPDAQIALQPLINFHGGGHINHSLFWENLAPAKNGGGGEPAGKLKTAIDEAFGGLDGLKKIMNAKLAGIQGSGWAWLVQDTETGAVGVRTYANQDPVVGQFKPLLGIDAWEHAY